MNGFTVAETPVLDLLGRVRARLQAVRLLRAVARVSAGVSIVLLAGLLVLRWAPPSPSVFAAVGLCCLLLAVSVIFWGAAPLRRRTSDAQLARFIEERTPSLDDRLVTSVALLSEHQRQAAGGVRMGPETSMPPAFAAPMIADAAAAARAVEPRRVVPDAALRRVAVRAIGASVVLAIALFAAAGPARQVLDAASLVLFPSRVRLEVRPGDARVEAGRGLTIEARLVGSRAPVDVLVQIDADGQWRDIHMTRNEAGEFGLTLASVATPFKYRVVAGTVSSPAYSVGLARAPRVTRIDLDYVFPSDLGLEARSEPNGGDIYAPAGTAVRMRISTDSPVVNGHLTLTGKTLPLVREAPTRLSATLQIASDDAYRIGLQSPEGLSNEGDTGFFIRILNNRPPEVHLTIPAGDRAVTRLEEVNIEAEVDDDYGIEGVDLVYAVRGVAERVVALPVPRRAKSAVVRHTLFLEDLEIRPGDFVSYYVRARDVRRGRRQNETKSDIFFLDVKPFENEFSLAQSQSMAGSGYAGAIDELVGLQRQVVAATWNLDRRAQAAARRSAEDIQSVARTETDLKARAEQTGSAFRQSAMRDPRSRLPGGGSTAGPPRPEEEAMAAAASAMGRAVASLEALTTARALPPEMEALNHLLEAQAAIKHRQIAMDPSAGGAAGNNNRNYDVSTLFDQELRRQQTTYETPNRQERQPEEPGFLEKVRELARRQDELVRRQQDLARAQLPEGDRTRQLEQLSRQQSELRHQADDMARTRARRESGSGHGAGIGSVSQQLRDISEAMGGTTSDLLRAPRQPSASARRALDNLHELERRLQPASGDGQRAIGDMQLESRELADWQRQIATSLARLGSADKRDGDEVQRLAGEQARLAERTQQLLSRLKSAAVRRGDHGAISAVGTAAREAERRRLAERMRATVVSPSGDARARAVVGDELARDLERLAETLGAPRNSAGDLARRLAADLIRTQELRAKLEGQERALDAAGRSGGRPTGGNGSQKTPGESGRTGEGRQGAGGTDLSELTEESLRDLQDAQQLLDRLQRDDPSASRNGAGFTLQGQGMITSAPGTEAFKRDFGQWQLLKRQAAVALDEAESALSKKLRSIEAANRLSAGVEDKAPLQYQKQVDQYFKAIAAKPSSVIGRQPSVGSQQTPVEDRPSPSQARRPAVE